MNDPETALMRMLYDEHAAALWRYAVRLTGDPARAEDVVQETLLRAWQHPEVSEDAERSARAWLFTVARNLIPRCYHCNKPLGIVGSARRPLSASWLAGYSRVEVIALSVLELIAGKETAARFPVSALRCRDEFDRACQKTPEVGVLVGGASSPFSFAPSRD